MRIFTGSAAVVISTVLTLGSIQAARAVTGPLPLHDAVCRYKLSVSIRTFTKKVLKKMKACQQDRMLMKIPTATDCTDYAQLSALYPRTFPKAEQKVADAAYKGCIKPTDPPVSPPSGLNLGSCAWPCETMTITTYTDVASCQVCQAKFTVQMGVQGIYGSSPPIQGTRETEASKCQAKIADAYTRYFTAKYKAQATCQYKEDKGTIPSTDCMNADLTGSVAKAEVSLSEKISECDPTALATLTSCGTTIADEQSCVLAFATGLSNTEYVNVYDSIPY